MGLPEGAAASAAMWLDFAERDLAVARDYVDDVPTSSQSSPPPENSIANHPTQTHEYPRPGYAQTRVP